jgi:hypothetical protein
MAKNDPIERALNRLSELRHAEPSDTVTAELAEFLRNRSNLVVAKAAVVVRELSLVALIPDLVAGFSKFMADAPRLDKRCAALTAIASALYELDYVEPEPYLAGIKHVQLEGSYGPPVDEAAKLRAVSAQGLLRTRHADLLSEVVQLLVDREPAARIGAIRALGVNGGEAGVLLLRLKVLTGDAELAVMAECFSALLVASADKSVKFVAKYIDSDDEATAEAAMLALGESRLPAAYSFLKEKWNRTVLMPVKRALLAAMAALKLEEAIAFLISLVESANAETAAAAVEALSIYRHNERVSESVRIAALTRKEKAIVEEYRDSFGS